MIPRQNYCCHSRSKRTRKRTIEKSRFSCYLRNFLMRLLQHDFFDFAECRKKWIKIFLNGWWQCLVFFVLNIDADTYGNLHQIVLKLFPTTRVQCYRTICVSMLSMCNSFVRRDTSRHLLMLFLTLNCRIIWIQWIQLNLLLPHKTIVLWLVNGFYISLVFVFTSGGIIAAEQPLKPFGDIVQCDLDDGCFSPNCIIVIFNRNRTVFSSRCISTMDSKLRAIYYWNLKFCVVRTILAQRKWEFCWLVFAGTKVDVWIVEYNNNCWITLNQHFLLIHVHTSVCRACMMPFCYLIQFENLIIIMRMCKTLRCGSGCSFVHSSVA